ncbi:DUF4838 domain-containing protein [Fulvivirgaceae bacterium BMA10]|uniref:DUF4838 domain-containing protein n=1 Tax=Splendidivirga corallicola TaxID=3051826 RepID=A0ABT8KP33_9BACT|nr:DUF4838 domain-containing protein [Fulvivirgaceae bacterium BMA10]
MKHSHIVSPLFLLLVLISCKPSNELIIADSGTSSYQIVVPDQADSVELKAGEQLQEYLEKISGTKLPLISEGDFSKGRSIWIGNTEKLGQVSINEHEILFKAEGNDLFIAGGSSKSTLYAVYTFLENELGLRFYAADAEKVPQMSVIGIDKGLNYRYEPAITTRTVHSRLFYQNHGFADKRKATYEAFPNYVPGARVHTFHRFVPESEYYSNHPEYYALRNGKRIPTQLCLTNTEVLRIVKDKVAALLEEHPEASVISVSQDDNQQYCQCESCSKIHEQEGSPSGSMIQFVNEVAEAFPEKTISTLAYQYTRSAPQNLKPRENVLITLCSIECDRSAPISEKCTDFSDDLIAWGKKTDNIRIWDYTTQFTNFLAPFPNLNTLQPNIQLFRDNHARWVFEQHSHHPSELFELRTYLTSKLLWNPDLNVDSLMHDFLTGYYEEAGEYIKKYIHTVHNSLEENSDFFLFLYGDPSQGFDSFLNAELLAQYDAWYNQAEEVVANKPEVLERVKRARMSVDYAILEASRRSLSKTFTMTETNEQGEQQVSKSLTDRIQRFHETCRKWDITLMNEMGYKVEEYVEAYETTLARNKQPNLAASKAVTLLEKPKKYANEDPQALTDGALGGASFYANWLGFEGNDLEAVIDLGQLMPVKEVSSAFLQVTNHIVFFPKSVSYYTSQDGQHYQKLDILTNAKPLSKASKVNDIQYFESRFEPINARYIKIKADNIDKAPIWHHGAGLPAWIFVDEVMVR